MSEKTPANIFEHLKKKAVDSVKNQPPSLKNIISRYVLGSPARTAESTSQSLPQVEVLDLDVEKSLNNIEQQLRQGLTDGSGKYRFGVQGDIEVAMGWAVGYKVESNLTQEDRLKWLVKFFDITQNVSLKEWLKDRLLVVFDSVYKANKTRFSPEAVAEVMQLEDAVRASSNDPQADSEDVVTLMVKLKEEKIKAARYLLN